MNPTFYTTEISRDEFLSDAGNIWRTYLVEEQPVPPLFVYSPVWSDSFETEGSISDWRNSTSTFSLVAKKFGDMDWDEENGRLELELDQNPFGDEGVYSAMVGRHLTGMLKGKTYILRYKMEEQTPSSITNTSIVILLDAKMNSGMPFPDIEGSPIPDIDGMVTFTFEAPAESFWILLGADKEDATSRTKIYIDDITLNEGWKLNIKCPLPGSIYANRNRYRFGFNGMEMDNQIYGYGMSYTTEFRQNDPRLGGRWWSTDPIVKPWESPYAGYSNNPIFYADPSGLDPQGSDDEKAINEDNPTILDEVVVTATPKSKLTSVTPIDNTTVSSTNSSSDYIAYQIEKRGEQSQKQHSLSYVNISGMFYGWGYKGIPNGRNPLRYGYSAAETQRLSTYAFTGVMVMTGVGGIGMNFTKWALGTRIASAGLNGAIQWGVNGWDAGKINVTAMLAGGLLFIPNWQSVLMQSTLSTSVQWTPEAKFMTIFSSGTQQVGLSDIAISGASSTGFNQVSRYLQFRQLQSARSSFNIYRLLLNQPHLAPTSSEVVRVGVVGLTFQHSRGVTGGVFNIMDEATQNATTK